MPLPRRPSSSWFGVALGLQLLALPAASAAGSPAAEPSPPLPQALAGSSTELMDLQDLLVTTASKSEERIGDAAAVLSVITREDIEQYGARNLLEVLERAPATFGIGSYLYPQNVLSIRGDVLTHFDSHVLLLLDGRPLRESIYGGLDTAIFTGFPVDAIERVEVIRGPGSVLYGSSAYAGVVNVITRTSSEGVHLKVNAGGGNLGARGASLSSHGAVGDLRYTAALRGYQTDGWRFHAIDEVGVDSSVLYGEAELGGTVRAEYRGFTLAAFYARSDQTHLGAKADWPSQTLMTSRAFVDLGYRAQLTSHWSFQVNGSWNHFDQDFILGAGPFVARTNDLMLEANTTLSPVQNLNVILGGTVSRYGGSADNAGFPSVPSYGEVWFTGYLQADYRPFPWVKLVAGGQVNKPATVAANVVPRLGAIFTFTPELGAKLLYGQAFRSAVQGETSITVPGVLLGNPALGPETVATVDAQLFYETPRARAALTVFRSAQSNLITRVPVDPASPARIYANAGSLTSFGGELEGRVRLLAWLSAQGSVSYATNRSGAGIWDFTHMPDLLAKVGAVYQFPRGVELGSWLEVVGASSDVARVNPAAKELNPAAGGYPYWSANLRADLQRLTEASWMPPLSVELYAQNLLDAETWAPEFSRRVINTLPSRPGRTVFARLQFSL